MSMSARKSSSDEAATEEWAQSLVGRDWEIYWVEEEDNKDDKIAAGAELSVATDANDSRHLDVPYPTDHAVFDIEMQHAFEDANGVNTTASGQETAEESQRQRQTTAASDSMEVETPVETAEPLVMEQTKGVGQDDDSEGSIIDDWYDGHILSLEQFPPKEENLGGGGGYVFRVHFVGEETIYHVNLVPSKVRPSARGWVQRTVALLRPPPAAGENIDDDPLSWESKLPPDTRRLQDAEALQELEKRILGHSTQRQQDTGATRKPLALIERGQDTSIVFPSTTDFDRIKRLWYLLEAQVLLRSKLAKIENPHGEDKYTDGVRNPTEPYVNHLVQGCKDVIQACAWYCKAWRLLKHYFGDGDGETREDDPHINFKNLTFEGLMLEYMEHGKDVIVNVATVDVDSCSSAGKRRLSASKNPASAGRRTKRRRGQLSLGNFDLEEDGFENVSTAAFYLEKDMFSTRLADIFVTALQSSISTSWYKTNLGNMFQALSHFVVHPLVLWKGQVGIILRNQDYISLFSGRDDEVDAANAVLVDVRVNRNAKGTPKELPLSQSSENAKGFLSQKAMNDYTAFSDSDEEDDPMFTYEQVQKCVAEIRNNPVLSRFNLFDDTHKLHALLHDVEILEKKARNLFTRLTENLLAPSRTEDEILKGLREILDAIESETSPLCHIEPLSSQNGTGIPPITRDDLVDAVTLREWFVGIAIVKRFRERRSRLLALYKKVEANLLPSLEQSTCLARISQIVKCRDDGIKCITRLYSDDQNHLDLAAMYERDLLTVSPEKQENLDLTAHACDLQLALSALSETPTITATEEKIACRIDIIAWGKDAHDFLAKIASVEGKAVSFEATRLLFGRLADLLRGKSQLRAKLLEHVAADDKTDSEICSFVSADLDCFCGSSAKAVRDVYETSSAWKERADSILTNLRIHGNPLAGEKVVSLKIPAMIDIKRIDDLISEYAESKVTIDGYSEYLFSVQYDCYQWSKDFQAGLFKDGIPFTEKLAFVEMAREKRPKGLIMDPTRSVVDTVVDLTAWYQNTLTTFTNVSEKVKLMLSPPGNTVSESSAFSLLIRGKIYPLLADGSEILDVFHSNRDTTYYFTARSARTLEILDHMFNLQKTSRAVTSEKIQSHELIQKLISRLVLEDKSQGFPLQLLVWFQWHLFVAEFVAHFDKPEKEGLPWSHVPSLLDAKKLRDSQPFVSDGIDLRYSLNAQTLIQTPSEDLIELKRVIKEAEELEYAIKLMFPRSKELLRGSLKNSQNVRQHLVQLKDYLSIFKSRSRGIGGMALNESLGSQLDNDIKIFSWLCKTFPYPFLHQDEASFSSSRDTSCADESGMIRIPWDALVLLYDRIPKALDGSGDFALCVLRVNELHKSCTQWNNEITTCTLLSNRGSKRREATSNADGEELNLVGDDQDDEVKLQMEKMELLASDPVLSKVEMPREKALKTMIQNSRQFETQLREFLARDYHGTNQDKSPFPTGRSLVGEKGQFILYRLTMSPLFDVMLSSMKNLSQISDNVFAVTPGKAAFDWMASAVAWIERLHHAVVTEAPFTHTAQKLLVIPTKTAKELCILGEDIFLQTTEGMRQTLSNHGIYVSTSAQKKRLTVTLKKDGAHHSVGGIVMRWCPILFDALRADLVKTEHWESKMQLLVTNFEKFNASVGGDQALDEETVYRFYQYREKLRRGLDEGHQSLTILPKKEQICAIYSVLHVVQAFLDDHFNAAGLNTKFAKEFYRNQPAIHDDRFTLLDNLLYRTFVASKDGNEWDKQMLIDPMDAKKTFRDICRSNLDTAFCNAAEKMKLDLRKGSETQCLCALKAWEIEKVMYEQYQREAGETRVSEDYRNKARSLKSNLTVKNLSLCIQILTGEIEPSALVKMTAEQLANQKAKLERERAAQEALREKVLTPGYKDQTSNEIQYVKPSLSKHSPPSSDKTPKEGIIQQSQGQEAESGTSECLKRSAASSSHSVYSSHAEERDDGNDITTNEHDDLSDDDGIPTLEADEVEDESGGVFRTSSSILKRSTFKLSNSKPAKAPPPPPSLATDTSWSVDKASESVGRGRRVNSSKGGEKFRIEILGNSKLAFSVAFYQEGFSSERMDNNLPENLVQKGRSRVDDFNKFLRDKLKGGKWKVDCLRLTTLTDMDSSVYKAFYKEFEAMERIAMFKLRGDPGNKLFLITPKYHGPVSHTGLVRFSHDTSTYAVVLTKRILSFSQSCLVLLAKSQPPATNKSRKISIPTQEQD